MGEDSSHADRSVASVTPGPDANAPNVPASPGAPAAPPQDAQDILIAGFNPGSVPSSPSHTLSRLGSKTLPGAGGGSGGTGGGQVSAITVVALLDKLVAMLEAVQENQRRMERRQAELEGVVRGVQGDVSRLAKSHTSTSNSVAKLLERSRKTGGHVKEVRERLDRQSGQVKRLEANHANLLKRNHFKVIIFQEDQEIPSTLLCKESTGDLATPSIQEDVPTSPPSEANRSHDEGLQTISLSSDEDEGPSGRRPAHHSVVDGDGDGGDLIAETQHHQHQQHQDEDDDEDEFPGPGIDRPERSRADKFKRSSLKKVDSLKKAFSRSSIEKKINKIVPPERREKIKKSFTPNHPKSPTSKSSSFRVSPMTFNIKKVRDGDGKAVAKAGESPSESPVASPTSTSPSAVVEVPTLGDLSLAEIHTSEEKANGKEFSAGEVILSVPGENRGAENGPVGVATLAEEEVLPEREEDEEEEEEGEEGEEEKNGVNHNGDEEEGEEKKVKEEKEVQEGESGPVRVSPTTTGAMPVQQASA